MSITKQLDFLSHAGIGPVEWRFQGGYTYRDVLPDRHEVSRSSLFFSHHASRAAAGRYIEKSGKDLKPMRGYHPKPKEYPQ